MNLVGRVRAIPAHSVVLNTLHIFNDGYSASFLLLLPFLATAQHLNLAQIGILGATLNIASLIVALPSNAIAEKLGGLRALTLAMIVYGIALTGIGVYGNYAWLMAMLIIGGLCFGLFHPVALGLISKWSTKENRGRMMGNFTAIGDIGRIGLAAALSFLIVYLGWRFTIFLYAGAALLVGSLLLVHVRKNHEKLTVHEQKPVDKLSIWQVLKNRRFVLATTADALDTSVSDSLYVFLPFLMLERGVNPALLGTFAAAFFVGNILGKTVLGRLADKTGAARVFIASEVLMALFIFLLAGSNTVVLIVVCSVILGIFTRGTIPVIKAMVADSVEHHGNYGKAFAIEAIAERACKTIAPIILGLIANSFGIIPAFVVMGFTVLLAAIPGILYNLTRPNLPTAPANLPD